MNRAVTITVTRVGGAGGNSRLITAPATAAADAGSDYTPTSGTLNWANGVSGDKTFNIPLLDDTLNEGKEVIRLALTNPVGNPALGLTTATVAIAPSDPQGPGTYLDQDGDRYRIKLAGRTGSLLYYRTDPDGDGKGPIELIELIGTLPDPFRPKASLAITVKKSGTSTDGGTVGPRRDYGNRPEEYFGSPGELERERHQPERVSRSHDIGNILERRRNHDPAHDESEAEDRISALAIGDGTTFDIGAGVSSLTASVVQGQGSFGGTKQKLGTFRVKGAVTGADIEIGGNVGAVVVGAFRDSRLFAGYSGPDVPDPAGFNFAATVTTFRSTGKVDGFANSRVIATTFKSVTITSLASANPAGLFGFYADASLGAVSVVAPTKFKYNAALPTPQGFGDFEVKIV